MRSRWLLFVIIFALLETQVNAQIWCNPITIGRPISTYYLGDKIPANTFFQFEIGQASWNASEVGIGQSTDGSGWNYATATYYADGTAPNKRVQRNIGDFQFTATGTWYISGRAKANSGDAWTWVDEGGWSNNQTLLASTSSGNCAYYTVNVLGDPTGVSAACKAGSSSAITLNWSKWLGRDVIILRNTTNSFSDPTNGTAYAVGNTIGTATVVYRGSATTIDDIGLAAGTQYYYKIYSENWSYYSAGVTTNATTRLNQPSVISGATSVCENGISRSYSVTNDALATSYTWSLPAGWTGSSTTNSITVTSPSGSSSGNVSVTANNACGSSIAQTLAVTVNTVPGTPSAISGSISVCQGSSQIYTVTSVPGWTYNWSATGTGWSGSSTTNSITYTAGSTNTTISVTGSNSCGTSATPSTLGVTVQPLTTVSLTSGAGTNNQNICGIGVSLSPNITFSIANASGATVSGLPGGVTGTYSAGVVTIGGAPTTTGSFTYNVNPTGGCGSASGTGTILVKPLFTYMRVLSGSTTVCAGGSFTGLAEAYAAGITDPAGLGAGVQAWLGYGATGTNPSTWTNWTVATFSSQNGNNDVMTATLTAPSAGSYDFAYRFSLDGCTYQYAGLTGSFWSSNSGVLSVSGATSISTHPNTGSQTICTGGSAPTYSVVASGAGLNYQWYRNNTGTNTGGTTVGTNSASYTADNSLAGTWYHYVVVTGTCGSATSNVSGSLIINSSVGGTASGSSPICFGSTSSLSVSGHTGSSFQWQQSADNASWSNVPSGGTASSYTTGSLSDNTYYKVLVTNGSCSPASSSSFQVVVSKLDFANIETANYTLCQGENIPTGLLTSRVYEPGVTNTAGAPAGISVEFGWNSTNTNPSGWSNWVAASFKEDAGNDDRFTVGGFGSALAPGVYYYSFRYKINSCNWQYGGYNSGFWDGSTNINGVLTVNGMSISNAGTDKAVCQGVAVAMTANTPLYGSGAWSVTSGPNLSSTQFSNTASATSNFTPTVAGTYTLRWTITNSPCTASFDETVVTSGATGTWIGPNGGLWTDAANWCGGVPGPATVVVIPTGSVVRIPTGTTLAGLTINNGGTINFDAGGTLNIGSGGAITNNGTFDAGTSTVNFVGAASVSGSSPTIFYNVNLNGGVDFGSNSTIGAGGTLRINAGGFVNTNPPAYACTSTLLYNINNTYSRSVEWKEGTASGAGYPGNVVIGLNTILNMGTLSQPINTCGNLTIDLGSRLTMGAVAQRLNVAGSVTVNGQLDLGTLVGGDISLGGNYLVGSSGVINNNDRAFFFIGNVGQTIAHTGGGTIYFEYLIIDKPGGDVDIVAGTNVEFKDGTNTVPTVLKMVRGSIDLNGGTLTFNSNATSTGTSPAPSYYLPLNSCLLQLDGGVNHRIYTSSGTGKIFMSGTYLPGLSDFLVQSLSANSTLLIDNNVTVRTSVGVDFGTAGSVGVNDGICTINSIFQIDRFGFCIQNSPRYGSASYLIYNNESQGFKRNFEWRSATPGAPGYPNHVIINGTDLELFTYDASVNGTDSDKPLNNDLGMSGDLTLRAANVYDGSGNLINSSPAKIIMGNAEMIANAHGTNGAKGMPFNLIVNGHVKVESGEVVLSNRPSSTSHLQVWKSWLNTSAAKGLVHNQKSVYFKGNTNEVIQVPTAITELFWNLYFDKGANLDMDILGGECRADNALFLWNNIMTHTRSTLPSRPTYGLMTIGPVVDAASTGIIGASATSYIDGMLRRYIPGTSQLSFAIGKETVSFNDYKPIKFTPVNNATTANYFTAEYNRGFNATPTAGSDVFLGNVLGIARNVYWQFDRGGTNTTEGTLTLPYVAQPPNDGTSIWRKFDGSIYTPCTASDCNAAIVKRSGSTWDFTVAGGNFETTTPVQVTYFLTSTELNTGLVTSFSPFTFGIGYDVILDIGLPVKLLNFGGKLLGNGNALLQWTIDRDKDLALFELERSIDGKNFTRIRTVSPNGIAYTAEDLISKGSYYYRLRVIEKSGTAFYSQVVFITKTGAAKTQLVNIFPRLGSGSTTLVIQSAKNQSAQLTVRDVSGKTVAVQVVQLIMGENRPVLELANLAKGLYLITLHTEDGLTASEKWIKN